VIVGVVPSSGECDHETPMYKPLILVEGLLGTGSQYLINASPLLEEDC